MQFLQTPVQIGLMALLVITSLLAMIRGGTPERLAMVAVVVGSVLTPLVQNWSNLDAPQWGIMAVDAACLAALVALTWRYDRPWLPWAAAFQLITVVTHVGYALTLEILARAYLSTSYLLFFGVLGAIAWGSVRPEGVKHDRRRTSGRDRHLRRS